MRKTLPTILAAILIFSQGCYYDNEEELYEFENQIIAANCNNLNVSYANEIFPIIQGNCSITGCHIAGGNGMLLENYNNVKAYVDNGSLLEVVVTSQTMPPSQPLTSCQIEQVESWINAGAPNN
jgi:hypothetical protein